MDWLLKIENLAIDAKNGNKKVRITEDISLNIADGEMMGIIGESGCGKSITALSIMGLTESNIQISEGKIFFKHICLNELPSAELRKMCGNEIGMVFQEPMTALNPVFTIEQQLAEPMRNHLSISKKEIKDRCLKLLKNVGIKNPEDVLKSYPHQLSGGMRQRVVIAMAISCSPQLLIADEPTTALDVTIQSQILHIIKKLICENKMSLLIISHDMGVISMMSEKISVMYAGQIVEQDLCQNILENPMHPYSKKLINAAKELNEGSKELTIVEGTVPRPGENLCGCKFAERCEVCFGRCKKEIPPLIKKDDSEGYIKCWKYVKG